MNSMKSISLVLCLCVLLNWGGGVLAEEIGASNIACINVRDFGAVGDGVTDDRQAIIDAFAAAQNNLPCEVYFPAGVYGISNGITINMDYGTGGLAVRGAGRDVTTIKYLEEGYNPDVTGKSTQWYGINIVATNSGAEVNSVMISGNIIVGCRSGIASSGSYNRNNVSVIGNEITNCSKYGINFDQHHYNTNISSNTIIDVGTGMRLTGAVDTSVNNCLIKNVQGQALFVSAGEGAVFVANCNIDGAGLDGQNAVGAIQAYKDTTLHVKGCVLENIQMTRGIHNATSVEGTSIRLLNGGDALSGASLLRCTDCDVNGRIAAIPSLAIVSSVVIESDNIGSNAITLGGKGSTVTGCIIKIDNYSAIKENEGCDYNVISNNITNRSITTVGEHSINVDNITRADIY